ncbi:VanZ family protein [Alkalicoccobacillus porphyridii]|uniref:VanZ-like domain-containing protein n=1 Tax=Alkalicoccobacillus porphyridii TaxID=2597270 RepID=A0A553ZVY4_9BACI|nr:VanZ family protein [Alkalicoccobacillus porphyridii]TSB45592.1 hypothetical protein FN960_15595 [Alkalicoccobacillus porphyridii]
MTSEHILSILQDNFILALFALIILSTLFLIGYFFIYRKLMNGKKQISFMKLIIFSMFIGYVLMVLGVTILQRGGSYYPGLVNLSLFSSYREAWLQFDVRNWQFVILNIVMFVPFGMLFPFLQPRFQKALWTIGAAFLFTLLIETFQFFTGLGIFELDDLFNNVLGAIIGYGFIMSILSLLEKRVKLALVYLSPLGLVLLLLAAMFTYYESKEFGNLYTGPNRAGNLDRAEITVDVEADEQEQTVSIYQAPSYSQEEADAFAEELFERLDVDTSDMEFYSYIETGLYSIQSEPSYSLWFDYADGSYSLSEFSHYDTELKDTDESNILKQLQPIDIHIPEVAEFEKTGTGTYTWWVRQLEEDNHLVDGFVTASYYEDDTIKSIDHKLITYDKVRNAQVKSEQQALDELLNGDFYSYLNDSKIDTLHLTDVNIKYMLDSKGYYQPVYSFEVLINGEESEIIIPSM